MIRTWTTWWVLLGALALGACDDSTAESAEPTDTGAGSLIDAFRADAAPREDAAPPVDATPLPTDAAGDEIDAEPSVQGLLEILPDRVTLELRDDGPSTQQFLARRVPVAGEPVDLDARSVAWRVEPQDLGVIDADGLFTSAGRGGRGTVYAQHQGDEAQAFVDIAAFDDILTPGTPADAPDRFRGEPRPDCAPRLVYPEALTAFPRNIQGVSFQWDRDGHDLFRVRFQAGDLSIDWFTGDDHLVPEGDAWEALKRDALDDALRITLSGVGAAGEAYCEGPTTSLFIDPSLLTGAVYYWSTGDVGIMRLAQGDTAPEPLLTPATAPFINCPACHALSRDGQRIAFTRTSFPPFGDLATSQIDDPTTLNYNPTGVVGYLPAFAPEGDRLVAETNGQLVVRRVDDATEIERLPLLPMMSAGAPDWSWQGDRVVAAALDGTFGGIITPQGVNLGDLALWRNIDGAWTQPEIIVEREGDQSNDKPSFSPDGTFIAFERTGDNAGGTAMADASARLFILRGEGDAPVELARANKEPGNGNSWPKWAPTDRRGRMWLAFSSLRDYGNELRQGGRESPNPQIWVTGIDPNAPHGTDPSAPAFWLPYQSTRSGNHIPYWAVYDKGEAAGGD